jgi:hypothetical protein
LLAIKDNPKWSRARSEKVVVDVSKAKVDEVRWRRKDHRSLE